MEKRENSSRQKLAGRFAQPGAAYRGKPFWSWNGELEKEELLPFAYGSKGIGEIATIPTAPAVQGAYYAMDHVLRTSLPMEGTAYSKPKR